MWCHPECSDKSGPDDGILKAGRDSSLRTVESDVIPAKGRIHRERFVTGLSTFDFRLLAYGLSEEFRCPLGFSRSIRFIIFRYPLSPPRFPSWFCWS